jgi:AraC family transcriptional regulator
VRNTERWDKIAAVRKMQDFMEENLHNPISLSQLARAAGYSQWHSSRVFKEVTGKTPFEHLRALRLSKAAEVLRAKQPKVIDVAFDFVFDSHEGFTRAFFRQFGESPKKFSRKSGPVQIFMPDRIRDYYLTLQKGDVKMTEKEKTNTVFVQVVERPRRKLILKRGVKAAHYFDYCEEVGCDVWEILSGIKEAMYEPAGMWLPENLVKPGTSTYVMGVEVAADFSGAIPEGLEIIELDPCKMMVFQGEPYEDDENFGDAIEDLWEVMKRYNPTVYGFEWADEDAPRFQLEPQGYRGYIEARPVRQINTGK